MGGRWETTRTEAFNDGVFAIAVTLLVLDIGVPESELNHLWHAIAHQWPAYLGYATSFITIGYGASLLVISLLFNGLWRAAARDRRLLIPEVSDAEVRAVDRATAPSIGFYIVVMALAILAPYVAAWGYLVIAIVAVARARSDSVSEQPVEASG
jgi:dolichol kinase